MQASSVDYCGYACSTYTFTPFGYEKNEVVELKVHPQYLNYGFQTTFLQLHFNQLDMLPTCALRFHSIVGEKGNMP